MMACAACCGAYAAVGKADFGLVVPVPQHVRLTGEKGVVLDGDCRIVCGTVSDEMIRNARLLQGYVEDLTGWHLPLASRPNRGKGIMLMVNEEVKGKESYRLTVGKHGILIEGSDPQGIFYGIQTFRKALPVVKERQAVEIPAVSISDTPRFGYRGMHLDVSRHCFSKAFVKQYLDMMALHNMNTFHWHLSDDQGWRLEIKKYPRLRDFGSTRSFTTLGRNSAVDDGTPYGGFFTQDDAREIVAYAAERYITVVPEIDMPGHALGALTAYPELGCTGGPYAVEGHWGVFDDILCAGNDSVFRFVEGVLDEVMEVFPSEYIHIGGDEVPRVRWEKCPKCQARIKAEGLAADGGQSAEARLQGYFTKRVETYLRKKGRRIIGWDELLDSDVDSSATIMSWRGVEGGLKASAKGHDVVMAPVSYCYFDYYQTEEYEWGEPFSFASVLPIEKTYSFDPIPSTLPQEAAAHVLGVQANLWSEYILSEDQAEYQVLPRMAALAECQWMAPEKKDFDAFKVRAGHLTEIYDLYGWKWAKHIFKQK